MVGHTSRASCCWWCLRRVIAARASALFSTFLSATKSNSSGKFQPRRADAGGARHTSGCDDVLSADGDFYSCEQVRGGITMCTVDHHLLSKMSLSVTNSLRKSA